jgi:pimeloyl-ACP methyl ester carboxylesterase
VAEVNVNGVKIAYQQLGEGPDLLFVHGLAANRAFWYGQYALPLQKHFRITLFDLRGHGYTSMPASGYSATDMAGDVAALLDHLKIERCAVVGHSYGGAVALEYACMQPQRVERLAIFDAKINRVQPKQMLSDSPHLTEFERAAASRTSHDWEKEDQVGLLFLEVVARQRVSGEMVSARDKFTPFGEGRGAMRNAKQWVDLVDTTSARSDFVKLGAGSDTIAKLPMPVLLMYGEYSRCLPSYRGMKELLPNAQCEIVPEGGHFFPMSHASVTLPRLAAFLGVELALPQRQPPSSVIGAG